eukprot:TRINITY_DN31043_c0_g1_i1.p1 TRINITY_DN31043_c0_g1~~TRINITY_DN31043_c0_g1_i1.p1  ORF type:complete len:353 (+),score=48.32 TRINITY_DN31043_c0_g1_i1:219-1277(+)
MRHPWDPHPPCRSRFLPTFIRSYPSFEGWYFRIIDPCRSCSFAVIVASNYLTTESAATLLFCLDDATHRVHTLTKDARITLINPPQHHRKKIFKPIGFEWEAPHIGKIVANADETKIDICLSGYHIKAILTSKVHWNHDSSYKGPEGWLRFLPLPTNWYISSVCSNATYEFKDKEGMEVHSQGWAHEEKNWGTTFPNGHIWLQAISESGNTKLVFAGGYYKLGNIIETPYICAMGYWSHKHQIHMRSVDVGTIFKDITIDPQRKTFSIKATNPRYTVLVTSSAPPESFSEPLLAPIGKVDWKPACKESFVANIKVEVYVHTIWGIPCFKKLVDTQSFKNAALEFGEDLLDGN